jgi:hypothetical protein
MRKLAALATVGVIALTGCAGSPQAAAYVGDTQISQSEVEHLSAVIADVSDDPTDIASTYTRGVLQILVRNEVARTVTAANPAAVTPELRQQVLTQQPQLAELMKTKDLTDLVSGLVDWQVLASSDAGRAAIVKGLGTTTVRLNPRMGVWDNTQAGIVTDSTGSISELAPGKV